MACAILAAMGLIKPDRLKTHLLLGELSLDGGIRSVKGALPMAVSAAENGLAGMVLPAENAPEAAVVEGIQVFGVETLPQVVEFLNGAQEVPPTRIDLQAVFAQDARYGVDLADVKGQAHAKRALEAARRLLASGTSPREVAENLGVSIPTLYRWIPAGSVVSEPAA